MAVLRPVFLTPLCYPIMSQESPLLRVPQEIWLHIHRLATIDWSPLALAYSERFHYWPLRVLDPFMEIREFLRVSNLLFLNGNTHSLIAECELLCPRQQALECPCQRDLIREHQS